TVLSTLSRHVALPIFAIMCAQYGAKVVVNDLGGTEQGEGADQVPALEVVKTITDAGGEAIANFGNVAKKDDAEAMIEAARKEFGDRKSTRLNSSHVKI